MIEPFEGTPQLTVQEALQLSELRKSQWILLAYTTVPAGNITLADGTVVHTEAKQCPIYGCGSCGQQQYTLVSPGAKLPASCKQCGKSMVAPS